MHPVPSDSAGGRPSSFVPALSTVRAAADTQLLPANSISKTTRVVSGFALGY